jgi:dihydrofolate reductase
VVIGSGSVAEQLAAADLIDELRLLVFPTVLGAGREGPAVLSVYSTREQLRRRGGQA